MQHFIQPSGDRLSLQILQDRSGAPRRPGAVSCGSIHFGGRDVVPTDMLGLAKE